MLFLGLFVAAQSYNPNIANQLNKLNRSVEHVKTFQNFGEKSVGSEASKKVVNWLVSEYQSYGYDSIRVDSFTKNSKTYRNVVVTQPGISDEYILVCGHYDTRNGPGASDNGSGIAAILETAWLLQGRETRRGVVFVNFDGEEEGFTGSQYYVNNYLNGFNGKLYMVLNIDQIGGTKGQKDNDKIKCERDEYNDPNTNNGASWLITDTMATLTELYTSLTPLIRSAYSSDYEPFEAKGVVITGLYQAAEDKYSHSPADTLGNMDTTSFKEAVKLSAAATLYFAQVPTFIGLPVPYGFEFEIYPNPADNIALVALPNEDGKLLNVRVLDALGKEVVHLPVHTNPIRLDVSHLRAGMYSVHIDGDDYHYWSKLVISH